MANINGRNAEGQGMELHTALVNLEDNILAVATRSGDRRRVYD